MSDQLGNEAIELTTAEGMDTYAIDSETVANFLLDHPDFFEGKTKLLAALDIPHESGPSISLIERQVAALREENNSSQRQLQQLLENAQRNETLLQKTQAVVIRLLSAQSITDTQERCTQAFQEQFGTDLCRLLVSAELDSAGFDVSQVQKTLKRMVEQRLPFCGLLKAEEVNLLYGEEADSVGSCALVPLFYEEQLIALLAIGHPDRDYYRDNMDTSLLTHLGQVLTQLLLRFN